MSDELTALSWHTGVSETAQVSQQEKKKKKRNWQPIQIFASTLANSKILIKLNSAEEVSLRPFCGGGIQPEPPVWQERNSMLFNTDLQLSATNISLLREQ